MSIYYNPDDPFLTEMKEWFITNQTSKEELLVGSKYCGILPSFPIMKGKDHPMYGKKHKDESKRKMSVAKAGIKKKPLTEEHKNKLRKKRPHVGKNIANGKSQEWIVTIIKTNEEFKIKNLNQFCRENGLAPGNLYKTVTGECRHHKGYSIRHG